MGNCQAIDAATLVIQHPCGKVDKLFLPVSASEVMKMNPGHYVALLISTTLYNHSSNSTDDHHKDAKQPVAGPVRLTRIKLLRPTDTLLLGQVYRLITTQEVMKGLLAKKHAKVKKIRQQDDEKENIGDQKRAVARSQLDKDDDNNNNKVKKQEKHRQRAATAPAASRSKTWQPSLLSISEATS